MNVIEGQANRKKKFSLIFYSLTFNNILNMIVMLILVVVTINVALNGGIFEKAKNAKEQTQVRTNQEALYAAAVGAYDEVSGKVNFTKLDEEATKLGFTVKSSGVYEKDGYTYTVNETTGIVTATKITSGGGGGGNNPKPSDVPEDLATYILGADGNGRNLSQILDVMDESSPTFFTFLQDPASADSKIHEDIKFAYMENHSDIFIRYGRDIYKFTINQSFDTEKNSLTKISTPEGNLGKYVTYQGKSWIVLYDDEKVELISAEALGEVTLGYNDEGAKTNVAVADEDSLTSEEEFKRAAWSYNNVITTLTDACKAETGIDTGIRNAGGPAEDIKTMKNTVVFSNLTTFKPNDGVTFENYEGETNGLKEGDENYEDDYKQMKALGILVTDTPAYYWLASRCVEVHSNDVCFNLYNITTSGNLSSAHLCRFESDGYEYSYEPANAVRPVVTLPSGALGEVPEGVGTRTNPIEL